MWHDCDFKKSDCVPHTYDRKKFGNLIVRYCILLSILRRMLMTNYYFWKVSAVNWALWNTIRMFGQVGSYQTMDKTLAVAAKKVQVLRTTHWKSCENC